MTAETPLDQGALEAASAAYHGADSRYDDPRLPGSIRAYLAHEAGKADSFQARVRKWLLACFGETISADRLERSHRFFEEATETVQAAGMSREDAHKLVDYTYARPVGEMSQEAGQALVTLAALCQAWPDIDVNEAAETELARIWTKVEKIRAKQAAKPHGSPLPVADPRAAQVHEAGQTVKPLPPKFARFGAHALREWLGNVEKWGEDPPEPWTWNDVPIIKAVMEYLEQQGTMKSTRPVEAADKAEGL